jgi:hypothetical protein
MGFCRFQCFNIFLHQTLTRLEFILLFHSVRNKVEKIYFATCLTEEQAFTIGARAGKQKILYFFRETAAANVCVQVVALSSTVALPYLLITM